MEFVHAHSPAVADPQATQFSGIPQTLQRFLADAEHPGAKHRQGRAGLRLDGHGRFRQSDPGTAPGNPQSGMCDDRRAGDLYGCRVDVSAGALEPPDASARNDRTTQCRQCTIDTGSGGTEVKTSSMQKDYTNAV